MLRPKTNEEFQVPYSPACDREPALLLAEVIEEANAAACRLLRCTPQDLVGRNPIELSLPVQPDGTSAARGLSVRLEAARAGLPQSFCWHVRRLDGIAVEMLVQLESNPGDPSGRTFIARMRELGELRHAGLLCEAERPLSQILDNTTAVVFVKDVQGRFLFANRRFIELFGGPDRPVIGQRDVDIFPPQMVQALRANDQAVLEQRQPQDFEETVQQDDGAHTYLSTKFPLVNGAGRVYAICGFATDITERKRIEEALRDAALAVSIESERAFKELVRHLAVILDVEYSFISVMDPALPGTMVMLALHAEGNVMENMQYPLAGTPCETVMAGGFRIYPQGVDAQFPADENFQVLGIESYAAYPLANPRGETFGLIAAFSRRPMRNAQFIESVLKIFAVRASAEIERSKAEKALRESEASYRAIFEASEEAIFVHDWDSGAIVDVNPKACSAYGYRYDEMLRLTPGAISSGVPPYTDENAAGLIQAAKLGRPQRVEWHRRNKDGSLHWDELFLKRAVIGGIPRVLCFTREITERKLAEEALRAGEEQYRAIFNSALDGLLVLTVEGIVMDANPAFVALFGHERESLLGLGAGHLLAKEDRHLAMGMLEKARMGQPLHTECRGLRSDGCTIDVEVRGVSMYYKGAPHLLFIARDITKRKRSEAQRALLESQLRQAQKMEAIGQLTGGIAHDFNNILTSIMGYHALAMERPTAAADPKLGNYLLQADASARRARDLVTQMLTFSRGQRSEVRPLPLPEVVKESLRLLGSILPSTIELSTALDRPVPLAMLDPVQAGQVLMNLCINARDAMGGRGSLRLAVEHRPGLEIVCSSCRKALHADFVELSVHDAGHGIAPENLERIFEPFFTTKEVGKGTGMGLAMVHGIVHEHGGHVVVESAPGRGANFRVLFPALQAETSPEEDIPGSIEVGRQSRLCGRVLLADDEASVVEFMRELLSGWGLEVTAEYNGMLAHERFLADPQAFDLVIADQTMPRMTGLEVARRLLAVRPEIPIVIYTGYSEGLSEHDTRAAGVRALLRKPLDTGELFRLLKNYLPAGGGIEQAPAMRR